jgi:hypothetical protein
VLIDTRLVFQTTSTDYTVTVRHHYGAGNAGWDLTTSNGATINYYDTNNTYISTIVPLSEIIDEDTESIAAIQGLDYIDVYANTSVNSEAMNIRVKNIAAFQNWPSVDDRDDDDDDRDWNDANNIFANSQDDETLIQSVITEAGTDTVDNLMELNANKEGSMTFLSNARYVSFGGVFALYPTTGSCPPSTYISTGKYLTTETLQFDTRTIDDFTTFTNHLTWTDYQFNITFDDDIFWDTTDYEENLYSFTVEGLDKKSTWKSTWETSGLGDGSEIQYNVADPSTTTGSLFDIIHGYYTDESVSGSMTTTTAVGGGAGIVTIAGVSVPGYFVPALTTGAIVFVGAGWYINKDKPTWKKWRGFKWT